MVASDLWVSKLVAHSVQCPAVRRLRREAARCALATRWSTEVGRSAVSLQCLGLDNIYVGTDKPLHHQHLPQGLFHSYKCKSLKKMVLRPQDDIVTFTEILRVREKKGGVSSGSSEVDLETRTMGRSQMTDTIFGGVGGASQRGSVEGQMNVIRRERHEAGRRG